MSINHPMTDNQLIALMTSTIYSQNYAHLDGRNVPPQQTGADWAVDEALCILDAMKNRGIVMLSQSITCPQDTCPVPGQDKVQDVDGTVAH